MLLLLRRRRRATSAVALDDSGDFKGTLARQRKEILVEGFILGNLEVKKTRLGMITSDRCLFVVPPSEDDESSDGIDKSRTGHCAGRCGEFSMSLSRASAKKFKWAVSVWVI